MNTILFAAALVLASVTIVSPLAGALEAPGDVQLSRARYVAVRGVYYPGLTIPGVAEPLAIVALCVLLASMSPPTSTFWLVALALAAEALAHFLYWALIVPMNGLWLAGESPPADILDFRFGPKIAASDQMALQDRWERSHVYRAIASTAAFVFLIAATLMWSS
jgi:hypothetical protein